VALQDGIDEGLLITDGDRARVAAFWSSWNTQEELDEALTKMVAEAREDGERTGSRQRGALDQLNNDRLIAEIASALSVFIEKYGYGGYLIDQLPKALVDRMTPEAQAMRIR
jgi:hypothetical protein